MAVPGVVDELRAEIARSGPIPFARFQEICLYSPRGGFYATRTGRISDSFSTAPTIHPAFGMLIARQAEEMWRLLGSPPVFDVVEVGSGDGALARAFTGAAPAISGDFAASLRYVAADYAPVWPGDGAAAMDDFLVTRADVAHVQRVRARGLEPFRGVAGCIIANELLDNFPVRRFVVRDGKVREVYVGLERDAFVEVLVPPAPSIEERLARSGISLTEGCRGEVCEGYDGWLGDVARVLQRGFVLMIDYGGVPAELYGAARPEGSLTCFRGHEVGEDPYVYAGEQDITSHVDFDALMRIGTAAGLETAGYTSQAEFLQCLGFADALQSLESSQLSTVHRQLHALAMATLVDPEETGAFRVLVQSKGVSLAYSLRGFAGG